MKSTCGPLHDHSSYNAFSHLNRKSLSKVGIGDGTNLWWGSLSLSKIQPVGIVTILNCRSLREQQKRKVTQIFPHTSPLKQVTKPSYTQRKGTSSSLKTKGHWEEPQSTGPTKLPQFTTLFSDSDLSYSSMTTHSSSNLNLAQKYPGLTVSSGFRFLMRLPCQVKPIWINLCAFLLLIICLSQTQPETLRGSRKAFSAPTAPNDIDHWSSRGKQCSHHPQKGFQVSPHHL